MCKYDVKYKDGIGFVARNFAECGTCEYREWCPLYIVSIRNKAKEYIGRGDKRNGHLSSEEAETLADEFIIEGAISVIENANKKLSFVNIEKGKEFLRTKLFNYDIVEQVKQLITLEEKRSEK